MTNKKVLVTGADGFIGSHLVERLVEVGYQVRAMVYYNSFDSWGWLQDLSSETLKSIEIVSGDIRDAYFVHSAVKDTDVVYHLAALIGIPYSYRNPESYVQTNMVGTLNVLQACRELGVSRMVHTSTSEVYGTAISVPISESHPLQGQSPYSASKIGADQMALSFYRSFDVPVTVIRPFNTYGPRQSTRAVIPVVITQIANGSRNLKLGALTPTRDFNFVSDTVRGFIAGADAEGAAGLEINLGTGFEISICDLVKVIADEMGIKVSIEEEQVRKRPQKSEVERLLADNALAKKILNWAPELHGLDGLRAGLSKTIKWFIEPSNLQKYKSGRYTV
jgi:NAD dependent epimerase/dehydratase